MVVYYIIFFALCHRQSNRNFCTWLRQSFHQLCYIIWYSSLWTSFLRGIYYCYRILESQSLIRTSFTLFCFSSIWTKSFIRFSVHYWKDISRYFRLKCGFSVRITTEYPSLIISPISWLVNWTHSRSIDSISGDATREENIRTFFASIVSSGSIFFIWITVEFRELFLGWFGIY